MWTQHAIGVLEGDAVALSSFLSLSQAHGLVNLNEIDVQWKGSAGEQDCVPIDVQELSSQKSMGISVRLRVWFCR